VHPVASFTLDIKSLLGETIACPHKGWASENPPSDLSTRLGASSQKTRSQPGLRGEPAATSTKHTVATGPTGGVGGNQQDTVAAGPTGEPDATETSPAMVRFGGTDHRRSTRPLDDSQRRQGTRMGKQPRYGSTLLIVALLLAVVIAVLLLTERGTPTGSGATVTQSSADWLVQSSADWLVLNRPWR